MTLAVDRPASVLPAGIGRETWRVVFACFALLMSVNAFYALFQGPPVDFSGQKATVPSNRDNLLYVGLWLSLYGLSALMLARTVLQRGLDIRLIAVAPFAAYILLSAAWADNTAGSIVPATMLVLDIVIAAALAQSIHPTQLLIVMARLNVGLVAVSLIMLALDPSRVISDPTRAGLLMSGELFGAYGSKANLGSSAGIAIVILLFMPETIAHRGRRALAIAVLVLGVILSNSASSQTGGVAAAAVLLAARVLPGMRRTIFATGSVLVVLWSFSLPFISLGDVTQLVGRSSDLTGRGTFWPMAPGLILERPFLGYGYLGFFNSGAYSRAWDIWRYQLYWFTPEFHNTLLDILISLGLVGAFGYVLTLGTAMSVVAHRTLESRSAEMLAAILILFTLGAASEFKFLAHNSLPTIFMFYCFFVGGRRYAARSPRPDTAPVPG